jgi:hypothetical protein
MNTHRLIPGIIGIILLITVFSACGTGRSKCNTKNKIRTEMGWM